MEAESSRNIALEQSIFGRWIFSHEDTLPSSVKRIGPKSTLKEFVLKDGNSFTGVVEDELEQGIQNTSVYGYWDVLGNKLRMGTSVADAEGLSVSVSGTEMAIGEDVRTYYNLQG